MKESHIEAHLARKVQALGWLTYKFTSPVRGVPDRLIILPNGRVVFVEVKRDDGVLSPAQEYQLNRLREHRCLVFVIWSKEEADELCVALEQYAKLPAAPVAS